MEAAIETVDDIYNDLQYICERLEKIGHHCMILWTGSQYVLGTSVGVTFLSNEPELQVNFLKHCQGCGTNEPQATWKENVLEKTDEKPDDNFNSTLKQAFELLNTHEESDKVDGGETGEIVVLVEEDDEDYLPEKEKHIVSRERNDIRPIKNAELRTDEPEMGTHYFAEKRPALDAMDELNSKPQLKKSVIKLKKLRQPKAETKQITDNTPNISETIEPTVKNDFTAKQTEHNRNDIVVDSVVLYNGMEVVDPEEALSSDTLVCFKCYKIYESLSKLKEHMTKQHKIKLGYLCQCGKFLSNKNDLEHHKNFVKHEHCKYCSKVCENESKLKTHMEDLHGVSLDDIKNEYKCEKCGSTFLFKQFLEMHHRKMPNCAEIIDKIESTVDKDITYTNEEGQSLTQNVEEVIAEQVKPPYKCVICKELKKNQRELKQHIFSSHMNNKIFLCVICGMQMKSRTSLIAHKKNHILKPFNCTDCRARYETMEQLEMHKEQECKGGDMENLKCDLCNYKGISRSALDTHKQVHTGHRPFSCNLCGKGMATKASLERHVQAMHGEAYHYKCGDCKKTFKTKDTFKRHLKVHLQPGFKCEVCGKTCTERGNLNKHMRTHTGEKPFVCEICGAKYGRKAMLQVHIRTHTGETPFKCDIEGCGKRFRSYALLKQHKAIHSSSYAFVCDVCGKAFKHLGRLNYHKKLHYSEYPYPCAYCPAQHKTMFIYKGHLAKHHPEMRQDLEQRFNIKLYECNMCSRVYGVKEDLTRHINIHMGYKPFKCSFCGKSFNDKSNLTAHEKNHTTKREFVCQICVKEFKHFKTLRLHHKTFHKSVPFPTNKTNPTICKTDKLSLGGNVVQIEVVKTERTGDHTYQFGNNVVMEDMKTPDPWRDGGTINVHTLEPIQSRITADPSHSLLEPLMIVENF